MNRAIVVLGVSALLSSACAKPKPHVVDPCACGARVCGDLCGVSCGACADDGTCAADGLSCKPAAAIGAACTTDTDCGSAHRICLNADGGIQVPDGYCSEPCSGATCPMGSSCTQDQKGDFVCLATCSANSDCQSGAGLTCTANVCRACVGDCTGKVCGDDGCGGSCGVIDPMVPACDVRGNVCSSGQCAANLGKIDSVTMTDYPNGLWDAAALDMTGQVAGGGVALVGGRTVESYNNTTLHQVATAGNAIGTVDIYKPGTPSSFTHLPTFSPALARPNAVVYNSAIYIAGGTAVAVAPTGQTDSPDATFIWETTSGGGTPQIVWDTSRASVPHPSMGGGAVVIGTTLYLVVGQTSDGQPSNLMDKYALTQTPGSDSWTIGATGTTRPTSRSYFAVATDGARLFVVGGWDGSNALSTVEIYDPAHGWTAAPNLPIATADPRAAIAGGHLYVFGGRAQPGPTSDGRPYVQSIDLTTGSVQLLGETTQTYGDQAVVSLGSGFFLFGALIFDNTDYAADWDILQFTVPTF